MYPLIIVVGMKGNLWSEGDIREAGLEARSRPEMVDHNCGYIVEQMERILGGLVDVSFTDMESGARYVTVGDSEMKHFILVISGEFVEGYHPDGEVWVDASFDQFCDENVEIEAVKESFGKRDEIDKVRIMGLEDDRLTQYTIPCDKKSLL